MTYLLHCPPNFEIVPFHIHCADSTPRVSTAQLAADGCEKSAVLHHVKSDQDKNTLTHRHDCTLKKLCHIKERALASPDKRDIHARMPSWAQIPTKRQLNNYLPHTTSFWILHPKKHAPAGAKICDDSKQTPFLLAVLRESGMTSVD